MTEFYAEPLDKAPGQPRSGPRVDRAGRPLLRAYWLVVYAVGLGLLARAPQLPWPTALAAVLICAAALAPAYFWCAGRSTGLPVFPVFALTFAWAFGLPLLTEHPSTMHYEPDDHLAAGLAVSGFLLLAMLVWLTLSRTRATRRRVLFVLDAERGVPWLIASLGIDAAFWMANQAGWVNLSAGAFGLARGVVIGLSTVASFVLPYLWTRGRLRSTTVSFASVLFLADAVTSMTGLLLINVLSKGALAVLGMVLGGRRIRVVPIAMLLAIIVPLHYGKQRMRELYWAHASGGVVTRLAPWQYPQFFAEWYGYAAQNLAGTESESTTESFTTRASLVQLFLLARDRQQHGTIPLAGATYAIIPGLLVPRVLMPDKPASHEGTYLLNIRYGLQTRADTRTSTIGWGLFNEAYGNFGYAGLAGLAIVLGVTLGAYARWTTDVPELSGRFLVAVLVLALAFQTEYSASVVITVLFQSTVALGGLLLVLGGRRVVAPGTSLRIRPAEAADALEDEFDAPAHAYVAP